MTKSDRNSPFGADWKHFEELFGGISALHQGKWQDLGCVHQFVKNMLKQTETNTDASSAKTATNLQTEVFETHRNVIVKLMVPNHVQPRNLQLFVNSSKLKIEGHGQRTQFVRLPTPVQPQYSKAEYRDGILQIQLRKRTNSDRFDEIYVRFL